MTRTLFESPPWPTLPVTGEPGLYPVHRIFCVGRNYAAHAAEMGSEVDREAPFYFTKSALSFLPSGQTYPYPPGTADYHHEVELVVAIGKPVFRVRAEAAMESVFGYAAGLDMTRRDLQAAAKQRARPWDVAKDVEGSAVIGPLTRADDFGLPGPQRIRLEVDTVLRQDGVLSDMVWTVAELVADLSRLYHLAPGDLILTGTPAGVGPVAPGAVIRGRIDGLASVDLIVGAPE